MALTQVTASQGTSLWEDLHPQPSLYKSAALLLELQRHRRWDEDSNLGIPLRMTTA